MWTTLAKSRFEVSAKPRGLSLDYLIIIMYNLQTSSDNHASMIYLHDLPHMATCDFEVGLVTMSPHNATQPSDDRVTESLSL